MKALVRNKGETVLEGFEGIDWNTGAPLTNPSWADGPYTLVQNYIPPNNEEPEQVVVEENEDDYVIIDGKKYSKEELRSLLE